MRVFRGTIAAFVAIILCCIQVHAVQLQDYSTNESDTGGVVGQVTITNVDSNDNSTRLNGAHIKIIDKDTEEEFLEIIRDDGTLVYELPFGNYWVSQVLAPDDYELNTRVYEFSLQLPPGPDASNIRVVNASVTMANEPSNPVINLEGEQIPLSVPSTADDPQNDPSPQGGAENTNPATSDTSNVLPFMIVFLGIIILACSVTLKRLNRKY